MPTSSDIRSQAVAYGSKRNNWALIVWISTVSLFISTFAIWCYEVWYEHYMNSNIVINNNPAVHQRGGGGGQAEPTLFEDTSSPQQVSLVIDKLNC